MDNEIYDYQILDMLKGKDELIRKQQAEIDSHKNVIKSQGKAINAYCKKIGELNEDTERTIAEKVEMESEINQLLNERRADKAVIDRLEVDLAEAYREFRQQRPTIGAVFNRAVWDKADKGE